MATSSSGGSVCGVASVQPIDDSVAYACATTLLHKCDFTGAIECITEINDQEYLSRISETFISQFATYVHEAEKIFLKDRIHIILLLPESLYAIRDKLVLIWIERAQTIKEWNLAIQGVACLQDQEQRKKILMLMLGRYKIIRDTIYSWALDNKLKLAFNLAQTFIACDTEARISRGRLTPMPEKVQNYYLLIFQGSCKFETVNRLVMDSSSSGSSSSTSSVEGASLPMIETYQLVQIKSFPIPKK